MTGDLGDLSGKTILAPTNDAFQYLLSALGQKVENASPDTVIDVSAACKADSTNLFKPNCLQMCMTSAVQLILYQILNTPLDAIPNATVPSANRINIAAKVSLYRT